MNAFILSTMLQLECLFWWRASSLVFLFFVFLMLGFSWAGRRSVCVPGLHPGPGLWAVRVTETRSDCNVEYLFLLNCIAFFICPCHDLASKKNKTLLQCQHNWIAFGDQEFHKCRNVQYNAILYNLIRNVTYSILQ